MDWFNPFEGSEGGGGGSGTDNYNELINKPSINNVVLSGNKTEDDLGLQKKISSNNKISSDNVSDLGAQNLFTNATEKQVWNAKQDAIQNLQDIQNGAAAGATAVQTISINGVQQTKDSGNIDLPAYPTTLPASDTTNLYDPTGTSPISGKGVAAAIGTLDVAAVGGSGSFISGISETNGKISATPTTMDTSLSNSSTNNNCPTSKTVYDDQQRQDAALAEVENKGAKNRFLYGDLIGITDNFSDKPLSLPAGEYKIMFVSSASSGAFAIRLKDSENNSIFYITANNAATTKIYDVTITTDAAKITVYSSVSNNFTNFMICTKEEWDISQAYVPYGKTNAELTAENTSQQAEINYAVNVGAKNLLRFDEIAAGSNKGQVVSINGITFTIQPDKSITAYGTATSGAYIFFYQDDTSNNYIDLFDGNHIWTGLPIGTTLNDVAVFYKVDGGSSISIDPVSTILPQVTGSKVILGIQVQKNKSYTQANPLVIKPMIRPAEITDPKYEPYALPNPILTPAAIKAVDEGSKNRCKLTATTQTVRNVTFTVDAESGTITANGTVTGGDAYFNLETSIGDKYTGNILSGGASNLKICISKGGSGQIAVRSESSDGVEIPDNATNTLFLFATNGTQLNNVTVKPMICTASDWAVSQKFVPYALPNPTLTPAAVKSVDEGAKNLLHFDQLGYSTVQGMSMVHRGVTFTLTDDTVVCSGTNDNTDASHCRLYIGSDRVYVTDLCDGNHILSGAPSGGGSGKWSMSAYYGVSGVSYYNRLDYGEGVLLTEPSESGYSILIDISIAKGQNASGLIFKPMICTSSDWDISHKFVPYADTNPVLTQEVNWNVNNGVKNLFDINTSLPLKIYHTTYTLSDGSLTVTSNGSWGHHSVPVNLPAGNYIFTATISNFSKDSSASESSVRIRVTDTTATGGIEIASKAVTGNGAFELPFTWTGGQCYIQYYPNYTSTTTYVSSFTASNNMIRPSSITDNTFVPYALPNPTLTPAAVKSVDEGAKNLVQLGFTSTSGSSSVPATTNNNDGTITVNGSRVGNATILVQDLITAQTSSVNTRYTLPAGNYVIAPTGNANIGLQVYKHDGTNLVGLGNAKIGALSFTYSDTDKIQYPYICIRLFCEGNFTINNFTFMPMICTASDWAVSQKFVPYCPTNRDLYETKAEKAEVHNLLSNITSSTITTYTDNLDKGHYTAFVVNNNLPADAPVADNMFIEIYIYSASTALIRAFPTGTAYVNQVFQKSKVSGIWREWYKFEGTAVSTQSAPASLMQAGRIDAELTDAGTYDTLSMQPETLTNGTTEMSGTEQDEPKSREEER